jgi:hypothetical protein
MIYSRPPRLITAEFGLWTADARVGPAVKAMRRKEQSPKRFARYVRPMRDVFEAYYDMS